MCNRYTFIILLPVAKDHLKLTTELLAFLNSTVFFFIFLPFFVVVASLFGLEKHTVNRTVSEHFYLSKSAPNTKAWCDNRAINSCFTWSGWFFIFSSWTFFPYSSFLLLLLIPLFKKVQKNYTYIYSKSSWRMFRRVYTLSVEEIR